MDPTTPNQNQPFPKTTPQPNNPTPESMPQFPDISTDPITHVVSSDSSFQTHIGTSPQSPNPSSPPPPKSKKPIIILALVIILFLIFGSTAALAYLVAYEKINLPLPQKTKDSISYMVQSLPLTPKTPKFILTKSIAAHDSIKTHKFDVSIAADLGGIQQSLGLGNLDFTAVGTVDYSNPKIIAAEFNLGLNKDLSVDFITKDQALYFKLNQVPTILTTFIGVDSTTFDPILQKWVFIDTKPKDTDARKYLEDNKKDEEPITKHILDASQRILSDESIKSQITIHSETLDGLSVYRVKLTPDATTLKLMDQYIEEEFTGKSTKDSEINEDISHVIFEMWIDKSTYYTRKVALNFDVAIPDYTGAMFMATPLPVTQAKGSVSIVAKFDEFGKQLNITPPSETMTIEEFYKKLMENSSFMMGNVENSRDAQRKADLAALRNSMNLYFVDCKKYPTTPTELTTSCKPTGSNSNGYLIQVPTDPLTNEDYFYNPSADGTGFELCANLENQSEKDSICSDPNYNYSVSN